jgi:acyl-coenzyme A thioesterase 13
MYVAVVLLSLPPLSSGYLAERLLCMCWQLCAVGKTLAYTSIRFMNEQHELVARGSHTKWVASFFPRFSYGILMVGELLSTLCRFTDHSMNARYIAQAWKDPQNITDVLSPKPEKPQ